MTEGTDKMLAIVRGQNLSLADGEKLSGKLWSIPDYVEEADLERVISRLKSWEGVQFVCPMQQAFAAHPPVFSDTPYPKRFSHGISVEWRDPRAACWPSDGSYCTRHADTMEEAEKIRDEFYADIMRDFRELEGRMEQRPRIQRVNYIDVEIVED